VVNVTGNQDICYYNFLCAHPLGNLSAFNNILSNLGYILLGLLFLLIILQREINHNRALLRNDLHALECGIPKHFGLFYAMGTALMMEGLLSACYHVCPNYTNFQFDTSFMYMIAGLCMLKLYQKRHPDINASAYSAYACLAVVIFFSVLGVVRPWPAAPAPQGRCTRVRAPAAPAPSPAPREEGRAGGAALLSACSALPTAAPRQVFGKGNTAFWIVFSVIHIIATLLLSTQLYYMGRWKLDSGICRRILHVLYTDCIRQCSGPLYVDRMVLLVMGNIINWSLAAYGLIMRPNDFASYLLAIGICNLLLYFAFYIIMKLRSGERIKLIPLLCIVCTSVVWGFALFFFFQGLSTWQVSSEPAERVGSCPQAHCEPTNGHFSSQTSFVSTNHAFTAAFPLHPPDIQHASMGSSPHFTYEAAELQRGQGTCSGAHSLRVAQLGFETRTTRLSPLPHRRLP